MNPPTPTPIPLQAVNDLYVAWKKQNPTDDSSIKEFSQRYDGVAGFNLAEGRDPSWLARKVLQADNLARPASQKLADKIRSGDEPQELSFGDILTDPVNVAREGAAKGVEMLGSSLPSAGLSMWALAGGNKARGLKTLGGLLPYGLISGYNETRDVPHAVTNAVSLAASPLLAQGAVKLAGQQGAGTLGKALAGISGGMVGDVAEIGAAPTADPEDNYLDRFQKNLPQFFKDPSNIISLGVAEGAFAATDPILQATQRKIAERTERVENTPGLYSTSGKAANLKQLMQSEFNLDIPNGVPDSTLRLAADAARMGDTQEAQRKIYASISDRLSEQQSSRFMELQKLPEERLAEYTKTVERDWQSPKEHLDELSFEFKTEEDAREFINQAIELDVPENSRLVGEKLFYWGTNDESLARLSQAGRAGKVNKMSLRGSNLFRNPAMQVVANITQPRIKSGGRKVVEEGVRPNKEGNYKTEAIIRAFEKRLPKDVVEHYREALPAFESKPGYIDKDRLFEAVDKALPEVEVTNLQAGEDVNKEYYAAIHKLETLGYKPGLNEDGSYDVLLDGEPVTEANFETYNIPPVERALIQKVRYGSDTSYPSDDAATGRYGVDPIPVSEMDRPTDILLRQRGREKFTGPHFGSSDENVLASVRGYFHDKDTFFPFEIQSDWGQEIHKQKKRDLTGEEDYGFDVADSPYLPRYERLALQQAIVHAKEGGATRIVLPDAETAMMIEGHDGSAKVISRELKPNVILDDDSYFDVPEARGVNVPGIGTLTGKAFVRKNNAVFATDGKTPLYAAQGFADAKLMDDVHTKYFNTKYERPKQEPGMRAHYGENGSLVNTMKKLGARFVRKTDLGKMTNQGASAYFNGKDNITGFEFDISNVNTDGLTLFRAMQKQADEATLLDHETQVKLTRLQDEMARNGEVMSTAQFVKRVKSMTELGRAGSDFDTDVMLRALLRIAGPDKLVSVFNDNRTVNGYATQGFSAEGSNVIGLNLNDSNVQQALQTVAHEMTHTSLADFKKNDPEGYQQLEDAVMSIDVASFEVLLQEANRKFGTNLDVNYASGKEFDLSIPNFSSQVAGERTAAISEIIIGRALGGQKTNKFLSALPVEVQRFIRNLMDKLRNWFTSGARYGRYLSPESQKVFNDVYNRLDKQVFYSERAADKLAKMFQANEAFDPLTLGRPNLKELSKSGVLSMKVQKDFVDDLTFMEREDLTFAQKHLWSGLSLTKAFPVARPLFERLHNYRSDIQKQLMTYFSELGQNAEHSLAHDAAMDNFEAWVHKLALDDKRLEAISGVFEADQNRRKDVDVLPGETVKDKLVSREEMRTTFKLSDEDAMMVERIRGLVERVAYQEFLDMSHRDYINQSTYLLSQFSGSLNEQQAQEIGRNVTMLATEAAKLEVTAQRAAKGGNKIEEMKARRLANIRRADLANRLTQELAAVGVALGADDVRVAQGVKIALLQADYRIKHVMATAKEGYAPQVRKGKFILRGVREDGSKFVRGFPTRKAAEAAWPRLKKEHELVSGEVTEKSKLGNHYRHYASETLQGIRRQFKSELGKLISQFDPETMTEQTSEVLNQIQQQFGDMDKELSDALGQKADPFKLKRNDVAGFEKQDYLPNIFDYINIKTIIGQKGIIAARAKFEMSKPEFYANKDLLEQFREITDYTLNSKNNEWSFPRKFVYVYYLGASMRHLFQNLTQPFIIGVPELASITQSFSEAPARMTKAYKQVADWNSKGTTGNKSLDRLMKQAEDEQVWNATMLHHYLPTEDLSVGPTSTTAFLRGKSGFLKRTKIQAAKAGRAVQSVLQVTAEASEVLNRQIAFAARANEIKEGASVKELEDLYVESSRFTNDVNFVGDKSNRPGFIRRSGNAHGLIMFTTSLMSFVINHLSLMASYWGQFSKGSVDAKSYKRNPDKFRLDNPGAYGLLMGAAMLTAFAGAMGIPFSQDADEVIEDLTGMRLSDMMRAGIIDIGKHFDLAEEEGDLLADAVMNGLPGAMNIGASQSVGLGRIFSFQTGQPFSFWDLLGAGGSIVERGLGSASAISSDPTNVENWERGIRKSMPAGLQYWHELINVVKNNQQVDTEGRIVSNPLDAGGSVSRLLGFTPTEVTQQRGSEFRVRRMEKRINDERVNAGRTIGRMLFDAASSQDKKKLDAARKEYRNFVRKNKLTVAQRSSLITSISDDVRARSGQTIDIPNPRMAAILSEVQQSNPDYQPEVITSLEKKQSAAGVAKQLGDPIALKLSIPSKSALKHQLLYERLVANGVNPTVAKMLADRKVEELEQLRGVPLPNLR